MKFIKLILLFLLTFNFASGKDSTRVLAFPYSFMSGGILQDTDAKFLAYADEIQNTASLAEGLKAIFNSADDDNELIKLISDPADLEEAKNFLLSVSDISSLKFNYVVSDGDDIVILFESMKAYAKDPASFMLINKEGKWVVSKKSSLYKFLAKNANKAKFSKKIKKSKSLEFFTADNTFLDTKLDEQILENSEIFFYYAEIYDAFFQKDFDKFRTFLDSDSAYAFEDKIGDASSDSEIALALAKELKEKRTYRNIANLGNIFLVFFDSTFEKAEQSHLKFEAIRDISCGVEIMNYGEDLDPVLYEFISR